MSEPKESTRGGNGFLVAGILSALGASACCVGPLVLLTLGVSGAWIGSLTALEPYRPIFIGLTLLFLGFAFYRLYLVRPSCSPESACANPRILKRQRWGFWIVPVLVLGLIGAGVALPFTLFAGTLQTVTLDVQNMTCAVCPITVKKALERVPGVTNAKVDFDKKTASISFDPDKASPVALTKATADVGYPSSLH